jgi:hypothetical protein
LEANRAPANDSRIEKILRTETYSYSTDRVFDVLYQSEAGRLIEIKDRGMRGWELLVVLSFKELNNSSGIRFKLTYSGVKL